MERTLFKFYPGDVVRITGCIHPMYEDLRNLDIVISRISLMEGSSYESRLFYYDTIIEINGKLISNYRFFADDLENIAELSKRKYIEKSRFISDYHCSQYCRCTFGCDPDFCPISPDYSIISNYFFPFDIVNILLLNPSSGSIWFSGTRGIVINVGFKEEDMEELYYMTISDSTPEEPLYNLLSYDVLLLSSHTEMKNKDIKSCFNNRFQRGTNKYLDKSIVTLDQSRLSTYVRRGALFDDRIKNIAEQL